MTFAHVAARRDVPRRGGDLLRLLDSRLLHEYWDFWPDGRCDRDHPHDFRRVNVLAVSLWGDLLDDGSLRLRFNCVLYGYGEENCRYA